MPRKHTYILLSISIIATLVSVGVFLFSFNIIKNKNIYASNLSHDIEQKVTEEENVSEFKKAISESKEKNKLVESFIVDQEKIDEFVTFLESQGDSIGVPINVRNIQISSVDPSIIESSFDGAGSFENVMHLIWVMENARYRIIIKNISINSTSDSKWQINMAIDVISRIIK